jgi:glutathione synthase/RimK-type ligase-like ATP-grasp enzyme
LNRENRPAEHIPRIGVLVSKTKRGSFPGVYTRLARIGEDMGIQLALFVPGETLFTDQGVSGYRLEKNHWKKMILPLPEVLYNQLRSRKTEQSADTRKEFAKWEQLGCPILNPQFLNKLAVWEILNQSLTLADHLPYTEAFRTTEQIKKFLRSYGGFYLKPAEGSLGRGVIAVIRRGRRFTTRYVSWRGKTHRLTSKRLSSMIRNCQSGIARRNYLIQQPLRLSRMRNRPFDIRVLVQKNAQGQWELTHSFYKVGPPGSIVTNVAAGASIKPVRDPSLADRLSAISIAAAIALEKKYPYLCELGIDIGVDNENKLWIIEANSRYSRSVLPTPVIENSLRRPLEYALSLIPSRGAPSGGNLLP